MEKFINILWIYLGVMNCILFVLMGADKIKAIKNKRRIPEATLFTLAFLGGGLGGTLGMYSFHHKTLHKKFAIGFPVITAVEAALFIWLVSGMY